jgi:transposase-like protein
MYTHGMSVREIQAHLIVYCDALRLKIRDEGTAIKQDS